MKPSPVVNRSREKRALSFLSRAPLVRRLHGWRFGTAGVRDAVVDRLLADGRAVREGGTVRLVEAAPIGAGSP